MQKKLLVNGKMREVTGWQAFSEVGKEIVTTGQPFQVLAQYEDGYETESGHILTVCEDGRALYTKNEFNQYVQSAKNAGNNWLSR